ncbi:MAG: FISUMP domain-containing protein [Bacteroidota bacterium]
MKLFITVLCSLIVFVTIMHAQAIPSRYSSTASITIKVFTSGTSTPVKNYAAALYDSSGGRIDSLIAQDTNVVKFSGVAITGVRPPGELPTGYFLEQNYPNPFNPTTRIQFTVPRAGPVSLKTYTILGQEDASLELTLEPGSYEVQYAPGGAAGVVFYRLITKDFAETKKMIQFGGEKKGKSKLTLVSSGIGSWTQRSGRISEYQANQFTVKLYNLASTYPSMLDTAFLITGLKRDSTVNIYVKEAKGVPCPGTPTVTYAGKTYHTVQIGNQCWLKENLDVGTMVDSMQNQTNNGIIEKYCYRNDTANCNTYGGLYQWNEAMQYDTTPGTQGICPTGWHIPSNNEFTTLATLVNNDGNALEAVGQSGGAGTNISGFSALLAGYRDITGYFGDLGITTTVWSSTEGYASLVGTLGLAYGNIAIYVYNFSKEYGVSVRCIKN